MKLNIETDIEKILECGSVYEIGIKFFGYANKSSYTIINEFLEKNNIVLAKKSRRLYKLIDKICPICNTIFETQENHIKEKTCCSHACSNSYFLYGKNNSDFDVNKKDERLKKVSDKLIEFNELNPRIKKEKEIKIKIKKEIKENPPRKSKLRKKSVYHILSKKEIPKCKMCDNLCKKHFRTYCSNDCRCKDPYILEKMSNISKIKMDERIQNKTHKGWCARNIESYPEKFWKQVLENNNLINYQFNYPISKKLLSDDEESYNYFLDFYFEDKKIDLEIDGKQHKYRKEHDLKRDELLKNYGIKVYRVEWNEINSENGKNKMKEKIDNFLSFYHSSCIS